MQEQRAEARGVAVTVLKLLKMCSNTTRANLWRVLAELRVNSIVSYTSMPVFNSATHGVHRCPSSVVTGTRIPCAYARRYYQSIIVRNIPYRPAHKKLKFTFTGCVCFLIWQSKEAPHILNFFSRCGPLQGLSVSSMSPNLRLVFL